MNDEKEMYLLGLSFSALSIDLLRDVNVNSSILAYWFS